MHRACRVKCQLGYYLSEIFNVGLNGDIVNQLALQSARVCSTLLTYSMIKRQGRREGEKLRQPSQAPGCTKIKIFFLESTIFEFLEAYFELSLNHIDVAPPEQFWTRTVLDTGQLNTRFHSLELSQIPPLR